MVDLVVIFSCAFSLRAVHSIGGVCGDVSVARRTAARADFVSQSGRRRVSRRFFARRTAARGETLCREEVIGTLCRQRRSSPYGKVGQLPQLVTVGSPYPLFFLRHDVVIINRAA